MAAGADGERVGSVALSGAAVVQRVGWIWRTTWQCPADAGNCQYVDTTAQPGQYYGYRVRAVNAPGVPGPWSRPMEIGRILTVGAPDAPVLTATPNEPHGDTQILLTWNKPVENGSAISQVHAGGVGYGPWDGSWADTGATLGVDATAWTHAGLEPGKRMYYRIKATNAQGDSPWSNAVEAKTRLADLPAPPENVRAAADGGNAIDVSWDPPKADGGMAITRYEVQWSADGVSGWRSAPHGGRRDPDLQAQRPASRRDPPLPGGGAEQPGPEPVVVPALRHGDHAGRGAGRAQSHRPGRGPRHHQPEVDQAGRQRLGDHHYDIQWSEDGKPGSWQDLTSVSPADVTAYVDSGLDPVTTRHYRVRAVNGAGAGTWSRAASATTPVKKEVGVGRPTAPLNLHLLAGDGFIDAVWDPPASDGGAEIKDYSVQFRGSGSWEKVPHDGAHTDTSIYEHSNGTLLTNGRRYYVRVAAINESGYTGPYASASAVPTKPQVPPSEPRNVEQTGGHGHIVVTWREPYGPGPSGADRLPGAVPGGL